MTVDIIIPNFNGSHLISENLPSVIESVRNFSGKIIIVDDGSLKKDYDNLIDIVDKLHTEEKEIVLVRHKKNLGFASAVNTGVNTSDAEFIVLLNSDVLPDKNFLVHPLKKYMVDNSVFGVGCMDKSIEGSSTILRGRGIGRWEKGLLLHSKGDISQEDTFWISGGSSIIRRSYYKKLGGMDTIYNPFYWEDIDLSYRAQKVGYKVVFDKESVVIHRHEEGAIKKHFSETKVRKIAYRNQFIFVWKNITTKSFLISHIMHLPVNLAGAIKRGDTGMVLGFFLALLRLPAIMSRRLKQQKMYKKSDAELIKFIA